MKEREPKIETAYAYIQEERGTRTYNGLIDEVAALYTDKEELMNLARLNNMFATEEETFVPLHVYEKEEDLPEEIRRRIRPNYGSDKKLPMEVLQKEDGVVYAVLPNTDSTEGAGHKFIWVLVTDPLLANKIAWGNGASGSHAEVIAIPLNKFPLNLRTGVNIRRGAHGDLGLVS